MNEEQYNLLKLFPTDYSLLTHKQIEDKLPQTLSYDKLVDLCQYLYYNELVIGSLNTTGLRITPKGLDALSKYEATTKREKEIAELSFKKLKYDVKISERIVKTYGSTRAMAILGFIFSAILLFLAIARALNIWPYHK